jgi:hypothetical protein
MILIEDTHWPLVVVGVCCGPRLEEACLDRARLRWRSDRGLTIGGPTAAFAT